MMPNDLSNKTAIWQARLWRSQLQWDRSLVAMESRFFQPRRFGNAFAWSIAVAVFTWIEIVLLRKPDSVLMACTVMGWLLIVTELLRREQVLQARERLRLQAWHREMAQGHVPPEVVEYLRTQDDGAGDADQTSLSGDNGDERAAEDVLRDEEERLRAAIKEAQSRVKNVAEYAVDDAPSGRRSARESVVSIAIAIGAGLFAFSYVLDVIVDDVRLPVPLLRTVATALVGGFLVSSTLYIWGTLQGRGDDPGGFQEVYRRLM